MKLSARILIFGFFLLYILAGISPTHAQTTATASAVISPEPSISRSVSPTLTPDQEGEVLAGSVQLGVFNSGGASYNPYQEGGPCDGYAAGQPCWIFDAEVTQVGRNAERARQFIYWVVTNPPIYNADILSSTWAITRNIMYLLIVFVIIGLALHLVISRTLRGPTFSGISLGFDRVTLMTIGVRVLSLLVFITFSYVLVLGLIQGSELISNFFIERLGGQDLFNIVFSDNANEEQNYAFVGYKNADPYEQDMVFTSLAVVRFTSFTYNFMGIILILRHIILMFLLIISPFLALLLPFIFIRNTGWIWVGEFFRWLFYGPLFALFISSLARIWKAGIPYSFDFTRVDTPGGQIYNTSINILYGGPAQSLSETNTANYVDTYAEYIIALVMLWTAILLPWLLLRIFRDYCCDILEKNQGVLMQILDKLRNINPPKSPAPVPTTPRPANTFGKEMQIPESRTINNREQITREKIIEKINNREIHEIETKDISRAYDLRVSNLKEVARYDTQRSQQSTVRETLANIQNPLRVSNPTDRKTYENLRNEFTQRANRGDKLARQIIEAATPRASQIKQTIPSDASSEELKQSINAPGKPVTIARSRVPSTRTISPSTVSNVSQKTHVEEETVKEVLKAISTESVLNEKQREERVKEVSERVHVTKEKVEEILSEAKTASVMETSDTQKVSADTIREVSEKTEMEQAEVEKVLDEVAAVSTQPKEQQVGSIAQKTGIAPDRVKRVLDATPEDQTPTPDPTVPSVSIEEYEEIRTMWMNHYRNSEIPKSESIKSRQDWVEDDMKKLKNTLDLLISPSVKDRQQGMQNVGDLLPFLLLGGFTDIETLTYIKAKLEAAKIIMDEMGRVEEAKEEAKKEVEDIEVIPAVEPVEEQKTMQAEMKKAMPIPEEESAESDEQKPDSALPGFADEKPQEKDPQLPDLPFKPKSTIIDPKEMKK